MPDNPSPAGDRVRPSASPGATPTDAGKTSGGGNSGHDQPADAQNKIRNQGNHPDTSLRDRETPDPLPELEE